MAIGRTDIEKRRPCSTSCRADAYSYTDLRASLTIRRAFQRIHNKDGDDPYRDPVRSSFVILQDDITPECVFIRNSHRRQTRVRPRDAMNRQHLPTGVDVNRFAQAHVGTHDVGHKL
jgi:hypothetical protein